MLQLRRHFYVAATGSPSMEPAGARIDGRPTMRPVPVRPSSRPARLVCRRGGAQRARGLAVLVGGWALGEPLALMKPSTAACFALAGAALWVLSERPAARRVRVLADGAAGVVGRHRGHRARRAARAGATRPGAWPRPTALCFLLLALALLSLDRAPGLPDRPAARGGGGLPLPARRGRVGLRRRDAADAAPADDGAPHRDPPRRPERRGDRGPPGPGRHRHLRPGHRGRHGGPLGVPGDHARGARGGGDRAGRRARRPLRPRVRRRPHHGGEPLALLGPGLVHLGAPASHRRAPPGRRGRAARDQRGAGGAGAGAHARAHRVGGAVPPAHRGVPRRHHDPPAGRGPLPQPGRAPQMFGLAEPAQAVGLPRARLHRSRAPRSRRRAGGRAAPQGDCRRRTWSRSRPPSRTASRFWIGAAATVVDWEGSPAILVSFVDVTEQRRLRDGGARGGEPSRGDQARQRGGARDQ